MRGTGVQDDLLPVGLPQRRVGAALLARGALGAVFQLLEDVLQEHALDLRRPRQAQHLRAGVRLGFGG